MKMSKDEALKKIEELKRYVSDEDKATTTKYYGLVAKNKSWVIIKNDTTAGSYRYVTGKYAYTTNWTNRADLTYKYFYELP
jgi:hypothetical protein